MRHVLLGLSGVAGAGKDTAANILVDLGFVKISLAMPMKFICKELFDFSDEQLWGPSEARNAPDPRYGGLTPRHALQTLGTEWGRACWPDIWVNRALKDARWYFDYDALGVVVPDVRFRNERAAIETAGGEVWRIVRPGAGLAGAAAAHLSENELTDSMFDVSHTLVNDGSLEQLAAKVKGLPVLGLNWDGRSAASDER
jgi:hypothetical protein